MRSVLRFIYVFLSAFTLIFFSVGSVKAEEYKLLVSIGEGFASKDYSAKIPVVLSNLPSSGISAMNFVIEFDSNLILNDVKTGELIRTSSDFSYYVRENRVHILFSDTTTGTNPIKREGTLCYLNFSITDSNTKSDLIVRRITSNNEVFADNSLNKFNPSFENGKVISKDKIHGVSRFKTWKITFNQEVDPYNLINNNVEIRDIKGVKINSELTLTNGGKTLEVNAPYGGYEVGKNYTLSVKNAFFSKRGNRLSEEQNINFYIQN
jgi:hypothetical protein